MNRQQKLWLSVAVILLTLVGCDQRFPPPIKTLTVSSAGVIDADIGQQGRFATVIGYDEPTGFWDLVQSARLYNWHHEGETPLIVRISPDGSVVALVGASRTSVWRTKDGQNIGFYTIPQNSADPSRLAKVRDIAVSNHGRHLAFALDDGRVLFINTRSGRRLEFFGHLIEARKQAIPDGWAGVNSVDISGNGRYVLSGGDDHQAIFWDTKTGQIIQKHQHTNRVHFVRLDARHKRAFSASIKADAAIWRLTDGKLVSRLKLKPREYVISAAAFDTSGEFIATGAPGRELRLWHLPSGALVQEWRVKTRGRGGAVVLSVSFADNHTLWSIASSGYAQLWKTK